MAGDLDGGFEVGQGQAQAEAAVEGTCLPLPTLDFSGLADLPVLGIIPAFLPADPVAWYPDGVVPAPRQLADGLPALRPRLGRQPVVGGAGAAFQPVVDALVDEVATAWDRRRLAARLFALATLLREGEGGDDVALEALRCAVADDEQHVLARFALERLLIDLGSTVELVTLLERPGAPASDTHRAGHVARAQVDDLPWALDIWWQAAEQHPKSLEPRLASYLVHLENGDAQAAATLAEMMFQATPDRRFWGVLAADRLARARPYWSAEDLKTALLDALKRRGATPALMAVGEELAFHSGDRGLSRALVEARIVEAEAAGDGAELAVLWARLGWLLEQTGDEEAAREACERALAQGGGGYARRLALALARREGSHTLIHRLQGARSNDESLPVGERAAALVERAAADFAHDRGPEGRTALARAVELDRTYRPALAALGRAAAELGDGSGQLQLFSAELTTLEAQASARGATRIADRAVRLALLRLRVNQDVPSALDACRRALAAVPGDRDAFLVAASILATLGQWAALAALYARRAGLPGVEPGEAVEYFTLAADLLRTRQGDAAGAARLLAQAMKLAPLHPYALRRAADAFALTGQRRAWAEAEARLGAAAPSHAVRAGRLYEMGDASEEGHAAEAFRDGTSLAALDGLVRACVRARDVGPLAEIPEARLHNAPLLRLTVAEALLAHGRAAEALALLPEGAMGASDAPLFRGFLDLRGVAAAQAGRWSELASVLVARAHLARGQARALLLVRAGEVRALRADDLPGALDAFQQALAADPTAPAARQALARWQSAEPTGDDGPLAGAATARRAGDWARHDALLRRAAERETRTLEAAGLRSAAGLGDESAPAYRPDLFATALARASTEAGLLGQRVQQHAHTPGREARELLRRQITTCLRAHDWTGARAAAEALLAQQPDSLPASLALCRVGALTGQPALAQAGLEVLARTTRTPASRELFQQAAAAVRTDPLSRARALMAAGQLAEAQALVEAGSGPEADRLLAELAARAGDKAAERAARLRLFAQLTGAEAADQALHIARLLADDPEAEQWLQRAVALDPRRSAARLEALEASPTLVADALDQVAAALGDRLLLGHQVTEDLAELVALHQRRGDRVATVLALEAAHYVGQATEHAAEVLPPAVLQASDWAAHVRDSGEAGATATLLALLADPLAAALAEARPAPLAGAERWQAEVADLFGRLALPRPGIGLATDARWGGRLVPDPVVLVPAREAPLDGHARFILGTVAAGFGQGRQLVLSTGPDLIAGCLAVLRRGASGNKSLISLENSVPPDRRARLLAAAPALSPEEQAALAAAPESAFLPTAVEALVEPFGSTQRRAGLLACGALAVALDVVLGRGGGSPRARQQALAASPPALALLAWALGPDHRALRAGGAA